MHSLLVRQLKRVGLKDGELPSDAEAWAELLERIDQAYETADQDRYLLERSLGVSSREMQEANEQLELKNQKLERVYEFFRLTLDHMLETVSRGAEPSELQGYLRHVRAEFDKIE